MIDIDCTFIYIREGDFCNGFIVFVKHENFVWRVYKINIKSLVIC